MRNSSSIIYLFWRHNDTEGSVEQQQASDYSCLTIRSVHSNSNPL